MKQADKDKLIKAIKEGKEITVSSDIMTFCATSEVAFTINWGDCTETIPYVQIDGLVGIEHLEPEAREFLEKLKQENC